MMSSHPRTPTASRLATRWSMRLSWAMGRCSYTADAVQEFADLLADAMYGTPAERFESMCFWAYFDEQGFGGDSELVVYDKLTQTVHALAEDAWAWLSDPDDTAGGVPLRIAGRGMPRYDLSAAYDDGVNLALVDRLGDDPMDRSELQAAYDDLWSRA